MESKNSEFVDAHILILKDSMLDEQIQKSINEGHPVFEAVSNTFDYYINSMKSSNDKYLFDRYLDFVDVKNRVLNNYSSNNEVVSLANIGECILMVDELLPSYLLNISRDIKGIVSKNGGFTSHSAIICKSLDIPYIVCDFPADYSGEVIIDNDSVILNPTDDKISFYSLLEEKENEYVKDLHDVNAYANISSISDCDKVTDEFKGVGLFRTEFMLLDSDIAFNIKAQADYYKEVLRKVGRPVTFRTFDVGDDKTLPYLRTTSKGVSNYYKYPVIFKNQISAILLAAKEYPGMVKIMFPMIEAIDEFNELKKTVVKISRDLHVKIPQIGMMLETQRALINIEDFSNVDFMSIGTNDLTEELFNLKRSKVILFEEIYDALASEVKKVIEFAKRRNISVSVCGELITVPKFFKKVYDNGLRDVSVTPSSLKTIYKALN